MTYQYKGYFDRMEHDRVLSLVENASTRTVWDHDSALGDTLREKCESLYVKLVEVTNVLINKGASGYFWILMGAPAASMFESSYTFDAAGALLEMGTKKIYPLGVLNWRWRVYVDPLLSSDLILIGVGEEDQPLEHYGVITLQNFII